MAWTAPRTWTDILSSAAHFNVDIRDNQLALKNPPTDNYIVNETLDYALTSTSRSNIDGTNLSFDLTTSGGAVLLIAVFSAKVSANSADINWEIDTVDQGSLIRISNTTTKPFFIPFIVEGLSAGSHNFKLQYKVNTSGTLTIYAGAGTANYDVHPQAFAREIS